MRDFLNLLRESKLLREEEATLKSVPEILKKNPEDAFLFDVGKEFKVVSGILATRHKFALGLGVKESRLLDEISKSYASKGKISKAKTAPFFENSARDLKKIPIPIQYKGMPKYFTSSIVAAKDPEYGLNLSYHRMQIKDGKTLHARVVRRHLFEFIQRNGEMDIAIILGADPSILLSAAATVEIGKSEYEIASYFKDLKLVELDNGIPVPQNAEIVIEARITKERAYEGPFVDLTGTWDIIRKEPVIKVKKVHYRNDPIFYTIMTGLREHALLMGMPREPAIYNAVNKVSKCIGVVLPVPGCSWLHGVVSIDKKSDDEIPKVVEAAFGAHSSMKHLFIVDSDIDVKNAAQVEWALATRFQADKHLTVFPRQYGSSLDPSIKEGLTAKAAFDCTIPVKKDRSKFKRQI
ncbi:MAG: UbiD family decarboxylase [archaeon]